MKRSEMIILISHSLAETFDKDSDGWEQDAEEVLNRIEKAGMLPPDRGLDDPMIGDWELTWEPENSPRPIMAKDMSFDGKNWTPCQLYFANGTVQVILDSSVSRMVRYRTLKDE